MTERQRMEEGRRMFQIFAARMFEQRVLTAYREKVAKERQQKLLEEIDDESRLEAQRKAKKAKEAQKRKDKAAKKKEVLAEEKAKKDADKAAEEAAKIEEEARKMEEQRVKAEEKRKKKDAAKKAEEDERLRKEAERLRRIQKHSADPVGLASSLPRRPPALEVFEFDIRDAVFRQQRCESVVADRVSNPFEIGSAETEPGVAGRRDRGHPIVDRDRTDGIGAPGNDISGRRPAGRQERRSAIGHGFSFLVR